MAADNHGLKLYLMRHGRAVPGNQLPDEVRWLDAVGRNEAQAVGEKLRDKKVRISLVVSSPLVRAVQTAELVARAINYDGELLALDSLKPEGAPARSAEELAELGDGVLAVFHEPHISALTSFLTKAPTTGFRTGQITLIEGDRKAWSLAP